MDDIRIETQRLVIRPLVETDLEGMYAMDSDAEVHRYLGNSPVTERQQVADVITMVRQQYEDHGIGRWAVEEKETGELVGWTGFKRMTYMVNGHEGHLDFGYRQARRFWGRGYATEAGTASLQYGIDVLGFDRIYAMTDVNNAASRRVLEKLGFRFSHTFLYDAAPDWRFLGMPTTWYEWRGNSGL